MCVRVRVPGHQEELLLLARLGRSLALVLVLVVIQPVPDHISKVRVNPPYSDKDPNAILVPKKFNWGKLEEKVRVNKQSLERVKDFPSQFLPRKKRLGKFIPLKPTYTLRRRPSADRSGSRHRRSPCLLSHHIEWVERIAWKKNNYIVNNDHDISMTMIIKLSMTKKKFKIVIHTLCFLLYLRLPWCVSWTTHDWYPMCIVEHFLWLIYWQLSVSRVTRDRRCRWQRAVWWVINALNIQNVFFLPKTLFSQCYFIDYCFPPN